jgi:hypothetical protein
MSRKTHRDDPVKQSVVNLLEDIDAAQMCLDVGNGIGAKEEVERACLCFRTSVLNRPDARLNDLIVSVELGRIRISIDYADDLGEVNLSYLAARR